jgi:Gas vesicle synthesis protein GvpL/GvpF
VTPDAIYVYAIARGGGCKLDGLRGLADAPVERIPVGDLEALVSRCERAAVEATEEALVRHDAVCSALMAEGTVAPARFGSAFADEEGVRREIEARREELRAILERLVGRVELGVRVLRATSSGKEAQRSGSGSAYLRARLAERQEALAAAAEVEERLGRLAAAHRSRVLETPELLLSASYLVERDAVEAFRGAVEQLDRARPDLDLMCTGPWPPYSFADGAE